MAARYLRSKLLAPRLHAESVFRHRLVDLLVGSSAQVWLLSAPAGFGKTTLVTQALDATTDDVAWFSIDRADNDATRFWTHLACAVLGVVVSGCSGSESSKNEASLVLVAGAAGKTGKLIVEELVQQGYLVRAFVRDSERAIIEGRPVWATGSFVIAVFGGTLGSILLLLRKPAAYYLFIASLAGVIVTMIHTLGRGIEFGPGEILGIVLMPLVVAAFLIWYSKQVQNKGWVS